MRVISFFREAEIASIVITIGLYDFGLVALNSHFLHRFFLGIENLYSCY